MILRSFAEKWGALSFFLYSPEVGIYGIVHKKLEKSKKWKKRGEVFLHLEGKKRSVTGATLVITTNVWITYRLRCY